MKAEQINAAVFTNITDVDSPEAFSESLTDMFNSFIDSEAANTPKLRKRIYWHYECLKKFLNKLKS